MMPPNTNNLLSVQVHLTYLVPTSSIRVVFMREVPRRNEHVMYQDKMFVVKDVIWEADKEKKVIVVLGEIED
jgi:hypothetical protein